MKNASALLIVGLLLCAAAPTIAEAPKAKPTAKASPLKMLGVDLDKLDPKLTASIMAEIGNRMLDDDKFRREQTALLRAAMGAARHRALKIKMALDENPSMGPLKRRIMLRNIH